MEYRRKNHGKFLLMYHIIFVVKYRKPLLEKYGQWMKDALLETAEEHDFQIREIEVDRDHVHMMIESVPKLSPLQIVRVLKQKSTHRIWNAYPGLKRHFWKERTFWSDGYFCSTLGNASLETIKAYIESQG
jgi:putative transposase